MVRWRLPFVFAKCHFELENGCPHRRHCHRRRRDKIRSNFVSSKSRQYSIFDLNALFSLQLSPISLLSLCSLSMVVNRMGSFRALGIYFDVQRYAHCSRLVYACWCRHERMVTFFQTLLPHYYIYYYYSIDDCHTHTCRQINDWTRFGIAAHKTR